MTRKSFASDVLLKIGLLTSVLGLGAWNNGEVGVDSWHVASWGLGTPESPIIVNRDNPWFKGWISEPSGFLLCGTGRYSHVFHNGGLSAYLRTFEWWGYGGSNAFTDDWSTPMRGLGDDSGQYCQWSDSYVEWTVRTGNLAPGGLYALALPYWDDDQGVTTSAPAKWYKLDDFVVVVPVVVISWLEDQPGVTISEQEQDFNDRARAAFDFIAFKGSKTSTAPPGWDPNNSRNPLQHYDPPDDIWTQCGIQFQVVRVFKFTANPLWWNYSNTSGPCSDSPGTREFMDDGPRNALIAAESDIGPAMEELLMDELHPLVVDFGWLNCPNFRGKAHPAVNGTPPVGGHVTIDTAKIYDSNVPAYLLRFLIAHEIGHVFLGAGHDEDPTNLMHDPPVNPPGEALRPSQCGTARDKAIAFSQRFQTFNEKIGRIPPHNTLTPAYPNGQDPSPMVLAHSCCQVGPAKNWYSATACLGIGGIIVPDGECSECCQYAQSPLNVDWARLGACAYQGGTVVEHYKCEEVCCRNIQTYEYEKTPQAECVYNDEGTIVETWLCEG